VLEERLFDFDPCLLGWGFFEFSVRNLLLGKEGGFASLSHFFYPIIFKN
jgi:hypothetical protein